MPIFYTDTGSLGRLEVSGSTAMSGSSNVLNIKGSGSAIVAVSGSAGGIMEVSDIGSSSDLFVVSSGSIDLFKISSTSSSQLLAVQSGSITVLSVETGSVVISGSLRVSQGITGSLFGSSSYALTASFALNGGGGGGGEGFPYAGTALITGSIVLTSGSGFPTLLASETLAANDFVNIFSGGVRKASNNDLTKQAHGFVSASYSSTNPVIVYYSGLNTGLTGLTAGARYFLGATGAETTTPPTTTAQLSQEIGVAISTNAILVNFGPAIIT